MALGRSRTTLLFASTVAIVVGVACGIDAVGTGATPDDGNGSSSGGASSGATSSGGSSSGNIADGAGDVTNADACVASGAEVCEDGLDNDCNGTKDCEDPACSQYACTKTEVDWTIVSVRAASVADAGAACATGWTNPRTLLQNVRASAATCACSCGAPNGNPCANAGTRNVSLRTGSSNCNDGSFGAVVDNGCQALPIAWDPSFNGAGMVAFGPTQVTCAASATLPAVVDDGAVVVCDLAASATPIACTGGTCVLEPGTDQICLMRSGDVPTCPAGFPARKVLTPSFTDGRACGACSCGTNATACTNREIAFYTNGGCNQGRRAAAIDGTCNSLSGSGTPTHYRYEATPNGACTAAAATVAVSGAIGTTPSTLCCPQ